MTSERFFMDDLKQLFYKRCFRLNHDAIISLLEEYDSVELNNVVVGLSSECFGLFAKSDIQYQLFYVEGNRMIGDVLRLNLDEEFRDDLLLLFASYLSSKYETLEPVGVFNNFQNYTRSFLEKNDRLTVSAQELKHFENFDFEIIAPGVKGIYVLPYLKKELFYKDFFDCPEIKSTPLGGMQYVYLMLNMKTNHIKIGRSANPKFRERTLQSQEPEIVLIAAWSAAQNVERQLHKKFSSKRIRGEWFRLKFLELTQIKEFMQTLASN